MCGFPTSMRLCVAWSSGEKRVEFLAWSDVLMDLIYPSSSQRTQGVPTAIAKDITVSMYRVMCSQVSVLIVSCC
jgi:hypothetical protein